MRRPQEFPDGRRARFAGHNDRRELVVRTPGSFVRFVRPTAHTEAPAMSQQSGSARRLSEGRAGRGEGRGIVLSHDNIVAGISYHLIDLKHASGMDDDGVKKTARR